MNASIDRGRLIVVSGPSGVGKTTIVHRLLESPRAVFSVSMTTRAKTGADTEGEDYYFVDEAHFRQAIEAGQLLEWAEVFGRLYGTPRGPVEAHLRAGRDVVLEIDVQGAVQVKRAMPDAMTIFIEPPDEQALLKRLRSRGRESEDEIQRRFAEARREIQLAHDCGAYAHFVVNDDLAAATARVWSIVNEGRAESEATA